MKLTIETNLKLLKQKSEKVNKIRAFELFPILEDSLDLNKGCGLSAIQVGLKLRVAIIRLSNCKLNLWNPKIIEKTDSFRFQGEACLSLPGLNIDTKRYYNIVIENGNGERYSLNGLRAVAVQHEIDHMDGKLIIDKGIKWRKRK